MLTEIIKKFITNEEIINESVFVSSEGPICAIGTDRGTLGIKEKDGRYKVAYFSIDREDGRFVSGGDNPTLNGWYKNLVECKDSAKAAYFEKEFSSFESAFQLSSYILSRILPPSNKIH